MAGFDVEFEIEVLACCAEDHRYRQAVKRSLGDFNPWSSDALASMWDVVSRLGPGDVLTGKILAYASKTASDEDLAEELERLGRLILRDAPTAPHYAHTVLAEWVREKEIVKGIWRVTTAIDDGDLDEAEKELVKVSRGRIEVNEDASFWFDTFDERQARRKHEKENPDTRRRVRTGFPTLDEHLNGGLGEQQLGLIGAYTNIGKSFAAENFAFYGALQGRMTIYVSTEMSKDLIDTRFDARLLGAKIDDLNNYDLSKADLLAFETKRARLMKRLSQRLWTVSVAQDTLTRQQLEVWFDELADAGRPVELAVIDSGDHMTTVPRQPDVRLRHSQAFADLKRLGDEYRIPVWSTVNATAPTSGKKKAHLLTEFEACGESKDKARHASAIVTLNQTEDECEDGIMRIGLPKNRNGPKNKVVWAATDFARGFMTETDPPDEELDDDE